MLNFNIPLWKLFRWFRRPQLWATGDWQLHHNSVPAHASHLIQSFFGETSHHTGDWQPLHGNMPTHASRLVRFFGETSNHQGYSAPLQPRFGALCLLAFPKSKITFEREELSDCWWDSGKYDGAVDGNWENCEVPGCLLWRGLRHHWPMYNISCNLYLLQ